ncbi:hypothetical protein TBC1_111514 [Lentimicrobium saccharophilum]|uniref:SecDF P1 head subdomain domain-containing protein n=1 Tax=Lentimicrobium saccharophilum TaxID=1678841 RepID=A0A0S7C083_9BACT|nr:hypothetical protein [Lentimicrobium saccharophilum]GAP43361.1 hypothetical protein TBC1_111514 [Lentimicrobium saccharophilum]
MRDLKNTLLIVFVFLIAFSSCSGLRKADNKVVNVNIDSVYNHILMDSILVSGWYYIIETNNGFKRQLDKSDEFYFVDPRPILVKDHFDKIELFETDFKGQYPDYIGLEIRINKEYVNLWATATEKSIGKRLGLIIDNKLVNAPQVNARIEGGMTALNRSVYSKEELKKFKTRLK